MEEQIFIRDLKEGEEKQDLQKLQAQTSTQTNTTRTSRAKLPSPLERGWG
jgi:hypothetical protein